MLDGHKQHVLGTGIASLVDENFNPSHFIGKIMKRTIQLLVLTMTFVLCASHSQAQRQNLFQVQLDQYNALENEKAKADFYNELPIITQNGVYRLMEPAEKGLVLTLADRSSALLNLETEATMSAVFKQVAVDRRAALYTSLDASVKTSLVKSLAASGDLKELDGVATLRSVNGRAVSDINRSGKEDEGDAPKTGTSFELLQEGVVVQTMKSEGDGTFTFANVVPGNYQVRQVTAGETVVGENPRALVVGEDLDPSITFLSQPCIQSISGSVTDEATKQAIEGLTMTLTRSGVVEGTRTAETDTEGRYTFANLEVGTYKITSCEPRKRDHTNRRENSCRQHGRPLAG